MLTKEEHDKFLASESGELAKKTIAFFRLWCIVELSSAVEQNKPVVVLGGRIVVQKIESVVVIMFDTSGMKVVCDNVRNLLDCAKAECTVPADKIREMARIRAMGDDDTDGVELVNRMAIGILEGGQHGISANRPEVAAFVCGEKDALRKMGLDVRCTGQERNRAKEIIAIASGGGRMEVLNELWNTWGLSTLASLGGAGETKTSTTTTTTTSLTAVSSSTWKWLCDMIDDAQAVWIAAKGGHFDVLDKLLACPGVNVDVAGTGGSTPLEVALQNEHTEVAELLESKGATAVGSSALQSNELIQSVEASSFSRGTDPFGESIKRRFDDLGEGFVGRRWLADKLVALLPGSEPGETKSSSASSSRCTIVVIYGESGTGKSSFVGRALDGPFCEKEGGPWMALHDRVLARHMCTVNDADSLDPLQWAKALAGQVYEKLKVVGAMNQVHSLGNHADSDSWLTWLQEIDSTRAVLDECLLPMLHNIEDVQTLLGGLDTIWIDSLDEAVSFICFYEMF